jgi:hypothetical protein
MATLPSLSQEPQAAALFTNQRGQVVFVDHSFLKLMDYSEGSTLSGEPFHKALKLNPKTAEQLLEEIQKKGELSDRLVELTELTPLNTLVSISGVATYDQNGSYLGANVTLRKVIKEAKLSTKERLAIVKDGVTAIAPEPTIPAEIPEHRMFVELYFTTHIRALYVLLSRLIGLNAQKNVDKVINAVAAQRGVAIQIENGLFLTDITDIDYESLRTVLAEVIAYALNVIGRKIVVKEIQAVDGQMHPGVMKLADEAGLVGLMR